MFKALYFCLALVLFSACNTVDNKNLTEKVVLEIALENNATIEFLTSVEYDKSKLVLKTDYPFKDKFEEGKFALDLFKKLKLKGVYYDLIQLMDPTNKDTTKIVKGSTLKKANRKQYHFLDDLKKLKNGKKLDFEKDIINERGLKTLRHPRSNLPMVKTLTCNGMQFKNLEKERIVLFRSQFGYYEVVLGYSLKPYDNKIKFFEISLGVN